METRLDLEKYAAALAAQYGSPRLSLKRLAEVLKWGEKKVRRLEKSGVLPQRGPDNCFSVLQVVSWLETGTLPAAEQRAVKRGRRAGNTKKRDITKDW